MAEMCNKKCVILTEYVLCRYAAYSITPHTSPDQSSSVTSSVQTVTFPSDDDTAEANRPGSKTEDVSKLFIDNGIVLVNFSEVTGQVIALENRQAKVGYVALRPTVM